MTTFLRFIWIYFVLLFASQGIFAINHFNINTQDTINKVFIEIDGIVSMEAEHANEQYGWMEKKGLPNSSGVTMVDQEPEEGGYLSFVIDFTKTGTYVIWALHAKSTTGYRPDQANDCFALFNGKQLELESNSSCHGKHAKVIGLGTHQTTLNWQSRPKTECAEDRNKKVIFNVESPGIYEFKISSRSRGYMLDKLVFVHYQNPYIPADMGPAETR